MLGYVGLCSLSTLAFNSLIDGKIAAILQPSGTLRAGRCNRIVTALRCSRRKPATETAHVVQNFCSNEKRDYNRRSLVERLAVYGSGAKRLKRQPWRLPHGAIAGVTAPY